MNLLSILGGNAFVMFNKEVAREVSVNGAIIFGQLCSSYESFGSKDMLTIRDGKEFFYLTSEVIEEETALSYKQQVKAIKDLEEAGYIESVIMGTPARKYFHITNKILKLYLPKENSSSDKMEELNEEQEPENIVKEQSVVFSRYDQRENLASNKGQDKPNQKRQAYKNKNEKEQFKNKKNNFVNKEGNNQDIIDSLVVEFMNKGISKSVCFRVLDEIGKKDDIWNFELYFRSCLQNTLYRSNVKHGRIDPIEKIKKNAESSGVPFYNWLEE